jgi:polar amino acid transport system ATP-binding protein
MNVISVKNLKKSFGSLDVLRGINLDINKGDVVAIIGPSGSGKSTLLRCLIELEHISGGSVFVGGSPLVENGHYKSSVEKSRLLSKMGMVFQNFNLFGHLTVEKNLILPLMTVKKVSESEALKRSDELLAKVGLSDKKNSYPSSLSGGQQQRVAIARALMMRPEILFFDEPTSSLDPELTGEVLDVIRGLAHEHMTMIVVTHEMSFARDVADRVIFMDGGLILEEGPPEKIFDNPENERIRSFLRRVTNN